MTYGHIHELGNAMIHQLRPKYFCEREYKPRVEIITSLAA